MRALFTTIPSRGHLHPLVPLARAMVARGHEVAVATAPEFAEAVHEAGLPLVPAGISEATAVERMRRRTEGGEAVPVAEWGLRMFGQEAAPPMAADLLEHVAHRRPHCVVHEEGEWAGPVVAAVLGVASIAVGWGAPVWTPAELRTIERAVSELWGRHRVQPRSPGGLFDHLFLDSCPPQLQSGDIASLGPVRRIRHHAAQQPAPPVAATAEGEPEIYVTLGTVPAFNRDPELLDAIVEGLSTEPVRLLVTVGPGNDPRSIREHPRVRAEAYVPQSVALAQSRVAITHGGAGSTVGALCAGLPVLVLPRGAPSQQRMAQACVRAGVGLALARSEVSARSVRGAVRRLLSDLRPRACAEAVRDAVAALPPPAVAAAWVEEVVAG